MNEIERHLAAAAGRSTVSVGEDITIKVDLVMAHDVSAPLALTQFDEIGIPGVFDPSKIIFILDHIYPAPNVDARQAHRDMCKFARRYAIRSFERGDGVCHQLLSEALRLPRGSVLAGADSHTCTAGGYGVLAFAIGSTECAATMATGTLDIEVPPAVAIYLDGKPSAGVYAKDIVLYLVGTFGVGGFTDRAIIFCGSWAQRASLAEKMTISNMGIEMGAMLSFFSEDVDPGPTVAVHRFDVGTIVPLMACPSFPANIHPVRELVGTPVTQVVIGSCTNGRVEDMREAAAVFREASVHPDVNCIVLPASKAVVEAMEQEGLSHVFRRAGAVITSPGCGPCFGGHMGLAGPDDTVVSTTNRNFTGRMGSKAAKIYLASPRSAAEAAAAGCIVLPGTMARLGVDSNE